SIAKWSAARRSHTEIDGRTDHHRLALRLCHDARRNDHDASAMTKPGGNSGPNAEVGGHAGLSRRIITPSHHPPIVLQGKAVRPSRGQSNNARESAGRRCAAQGWIAARKNSAVTQNICAEIKPSRN